jgi:hypothetical protein
MRLQITFDQKEADALVKLAYSEFRDPRSQAEMIIWKELHRLGLLTQEEKDLDKQDSRE